MPVATRHSSVHLRKCGFTENGDLVSKIVSIFQVQHNPAFPQDDIVHQYKYIGAAPQDGA